MKYKLIKEYPGSPKLGKELNYTGNQWDDNNQIAVSIVKSSTFLEFWEEVIEKDYEILSVLIRRSDKHQEKIVDKADSDDYITALINCDGNSIHSIKRLSDGEIFTIGDKVDGITFQNKKIVNIRNDIYNRLTLDCGTLITQMMSVRKTKQPLFTTEDGVDIYEGNTYILVRKGTVSKNFCSFTYTAISNKSMWNSQQKNYLLFSTKEKAEEYILMNKPVLSLNDVQNNSNITIGGMKSLTYLVKSKI